MYQVHSLNFLSINRFSLKKYFIIRTFCNVEGPIEMNDGEFVKVIAMFN